MTEIRMLALSPAGYLREVTAEPGRVRPAMYAAIGCRTVTCVHLGDDLDMWADDEGLMVEDPEVNLAASAVAYLLGGMSTTFVGTVVYAGLNRHGETVSLTTEQYDTITELLASMTVTSFGVQAPDPSRPRTEVTVYHNNDGDHFLGYEPHHVAHRVFGYTESRTVADLDAAMAVADRAFTMFNAPLEVLNSQDLDVAVGYRKLGLRSLSVGDLVRVGEVWLACGRLGWQQVDPPQVAGTDTP